MGAGERFGGTITATMSTLYRPMVQKGLPAPDLIKLDLQGFELEAMKGGDRRVRRLRTR